MPGPEADDELAPARLRFTRSAKLGHGSFGDVYRGVLDAESAVAVKVLRAGSVVAARQFRRELRRYAALSVHGVVNFYGFARSGGPGAHADVLVTELMAGGSLRAALDAARATQAPIPRPAALRVAEMAANALAEIHARGFSHGDVKPSNVLLSAPLAPGAPRLRAKFVDFGLSRALRDAGGGGSGGGGGSSDDEGDGGLLGALPAASPGAPAPVEPRGTPAYLAPEAWRGSASLGNPAVAAAADVYALGILLYEVDTGRVPWAGLSEWSIFGAVYHNAERPPYPPAGDASAGPVAGLRPIVERCWAQDFANRPDAQEVARLARGLRRAAGLASPSFSSAGDSAPASPAGAPAPPLEDTLERRARGHAPSVASAEEHAEALRAMRMIPLPDSPAPHAPIPAWAEAASESAAAAAAAGTAAPKATEAGEAEAEAESEAEAEAEAEAETEAAAQDVGEMGVAGAQEPELDVAGASQADQPGLPDSPIEVDPRVENSTAPSLAGRGSAQDVTMSNVSDLADANVAEQVGHGLPIGKEEEEVSTPDEPGAADAGASDAGGGDAGVMARGGLDLPFGFQASPRASGASVQAGASGGAPEAQQGGAGGSLPEGAQLVGAYDSSRRSYASPPGPDGSVHMQVTIQGPKIIEIESVQVSQQGHFGEMSTVSAFVPLPPGEPENVPSRPSPSGAAAAENSAAPQQPAPAAPAPAQPAPEIDDAAMAQHPGVINWGDRERQAAPRAQPQTEMLKHFNARIPVPRDEDDHDDDIRVSISSSVAYADAESSHSGSTQRTQSYGDSSTNLSVPRLHHVADPAAPRSPPRRAAPVLAPPPPPPAASPAGAGGAERAAHRRSAEEEAPPPPAPGAASLPPPFRSGGGRAPFGAPPGGLISSPSTGSRGGGSQPSLPSSPARLTPSSSMARADSTHLSLDAPASPASVPSSAFARARAKSPGNTRFVRRAHDAPAPPPPPGAAPGADPALAAPVPRLPTLPAGPDDPRSEYSLGAPARAARAAAPLAAAPLDGAAPAAPASVTELDYPLKAAVRANDVGAVLHALQSAGADADGAAHALRALGVLVSGHAAHAGAAVRAGALEEVAVAAARHARGSAGLARAACDVVFHLAAAGSAEVEAELRSNGACEHVLATLRWHPTAVPAVQAAAMALSALCRAGPAMRAIVVAQGGALAATRALARAAHAFDGDIPVAVAALDALAALAAAHPAALADAGAIPAVVAAADRLAREPVDENAVRVLHAAARHPAGRAALLAEPAGVGAVARIMMRSRQSLHAAHALILACDVVGEVAAAGPQVATAAIVGSSAVEAVLMAASLVDAVEPFGAGTALAVHSLLCLRRLAALGLDMCVVLENAHALQVASSVVLARFEDMDVAIQAAMLIGSLVQQLAGGPMIRAGVAPALDVLRSLDEQWLLEVRVLEPVRQAIEVLEKAQGVRASARPASETIKMAPVKAKGGDRIGGRALFRWRKR